MSRPMHITIIRDPEFTFVSSCVKYMMFFFNFAFWIVSGLLVSVGSWAFLERYREDGVPIVKSAADVFLNISLAIIILGGIIFLLSFAGCVGALRENTCLLKLYSFFFLLIFLAEVTMATMIFAFPEKVLDAIKDNLSQEVIVKYRDDDNLRNLIDVMQKEFSCCGLSDKGYLDWSDNIYFNCTLKNPSPERCAVPYSCCKNPINMDSGLVNSMCGYKMQNLSLSEARKVINTEGCVETLNVSVQRNLTNVAAVACGIAAAQLVVLYLSRTLLGQIDLQKIHWRH